jgi:glycosyltransferase involved in cell wall biosynthesis
MRIPYSTLIRTFNSSNTLPDTLCSLARQTISPSEYIFVDSGSTDGTLTMLPHASTLHRYVGKQFNFSEAINQGVNYVSTDYVLIISSHTKLTNTHAIKYALTLLSSNDSIGAAYFCDENTGNLRHSIIDKSIFDGFNGLWNTCSVIRVNLLRKRGFLSEVFSAEDQEWARWLLFTNEQKIARIAGAGKEDKNRYNFGKYGQKKMINEYIAIAYFANRKLLSPKNIARILLEAIRENDTLMNTKGKGSLVLLGRLRRRSKLNLACRILACYLVKPRYKSRYF